MRLTRLSVSRAVVPGALAAALLLTGCSSSSASDTDASAAQAEEIEVIVGTGKTTMDDISWGVIDSDDPAFNAAVEELTLLLNAASPGGLAEVNINAHGPSLIGINLLTDSEDGTITAAQVTATLDALATWNAPTQIGKFTIKGFNNNFGAGEILAAAGEAGVNPAMLDEMYSEISIPGDQMGAIYA